MDAQIGQEWPWGILKSKLGHKEAGAGTLKLIFSLLILVTNS